MVIARCGEQAGLAAFERMAAAHAALGEGDYRFGPLSSGSRLDVRVRTTALLRDLLRRQRS